jgi:signal peptidase II
MTRSLAARRALAYGVAAAVFVLDRITKLLIQANVSAWDSYTVIPGFFSIVHAENPGAAFSLFAASQSEWRSFFLVGLSSCAMVLVAALLWQPGGRVAESRALRIGLALILGGALGNNYDRVFVGTVTDFLDFFLGAMHFPAFNVADSAISIGAALVVLDMLRSRRPAPAPAAKA